MFRSFSLSILLLLNTRTMNCLNLQKYRFLLKTILCVLPMQQRKLVILRHNESEKRLRSNRVSRLCRSFAMFAWEHRTYDTS